MTCEYCGNKIEKVGEVWAYFKYQGGVGLTDSQTYFCDSRDRFSSIRAYRLLLPHEPSKQSIVHQILNDL